MATPPLDLDRHDARSGASITADVGHSVSLVIFVYILHMAARCGADKVPFSLGRSGATEGRRKEDAAFRTFSPLCQNTQVQPRYKISVPFFSLLRSSSLPKPLRTVYLGGLFPPSQKIKQKQLAGRLVAVLGFGKKGRCMAVGGQQRGELHEMTLERRSEEINSRAPCSAQAGKKAAPSSRPAGFLLPSFVQIGCLATNIVNK